MTAKSDGSGKGPQGPAGDAGGPKRPSAIIDLKATEVPAKETSQARPTAGAGATGAGQPTDTAKVMAARTDAPAAGKSDTPKASAAAAPPRTAEKPQVTAAIQQPAARSGPSFAGFATHMAAGIAGGFLALLGADLIGQQLGFAGMPLGSATNELQRRVEMLEQARDRNAVPADLAQKVTAAEKRLARIDDVTKGLADVQAAQAKLATDTKTLEGRLAQPAANAEVAGRVAKLEQTLSTLAAAAAGDPQQRIPQLAALSGKLTDLEQALNNQLAEVRRGVSQDIDARAGQAVEASEAARSGTQRLDRELSAVKTEAARTVQRLETFKATDDRLEQAVRAAQEEAGSAKSALEGLRNDVLAQLKTVARPQDVSTAIAPLGAKIATLEQGLAGVVKSEQDRKTNAERIVLSLELANLRRALDRGSGYATELAEVKKVAGSAVDLSVLDRYREQGVPTIVELSREFRGVANAALDAESEQPDASVIDRLLSGAKSIVRVRKTSASTDDKSAEGVLARMESALKLAKLTDVIAESKALSPKAQASAQAWLTKIDARAAVDRAIAQIEDELKVSLGGKPQPEKRTQ